MVFHSTSLGRSKIKRGWRIERSFKKYIRPRLWVKPHSPLPSSKPCSSLNPEMKFFSGSNFFVSEQLFLAYQRMKHLDLLTMTSFNSWRHIWLPLLNIVNLFFIYLFIFYLFICQGSSVQTTCVLLRRCGVTCGGGLRTLVTTREDLNSTCVEHESTNSKFNQ